LRSLECRVKTKKEKWEDKEKNGEMLELRTPRKTVGVQYQRGEKNRALT